MTHPATSPITIAARTAFQALLLLTLLAGQKAWGQIDETDLGTQNPDVLVQTLMGAGVTFNNVTYQGTGGSSGTFYGGGPVVGFDAGIILSTGSALGVAGTAGVTSSTCANSPGDADLALLSGNPVSQLFDATILEFDFTPIFNNITFRYVFASEEYNQYVGSDYNDVFGFYINGVNAALIPGTSTIVSTNNVNNCVNANRYIDNVGSSQGGACPLNVPSANRGTPMNGLTTILAVSFAVTPGVSNHIKLAIADVWDCRNDSNVFIEANSFISAFTHTPTETSTSTETACGWPGLTCTPTPTWTPPPPTNTEVPCGWPGFTCTKTATDTRTNTPTITPTFTRTPPPSVTTTPDIRPTPRPTNTRTRTATATRTFTTTPTPTLTPCGWPGLTCTHTPTITPSPTPIFTDIFEVDKNLFNPSNPVSIYVNYTPHPGLYSLTVYNSAGEQIKTLDGPRMLSAPISQSYLWNGTNKFGEQCASGVYLFRLIEPFDTKIKRVLLVN